MKFIKIVTVALAVAGFSLSALAQRGADVFANPTTFIALTLTNQAIASGAVSNILDMRGAQGIAKLDVFSVADNAAGTLGFSLSGSTDRTNWTTYSTCAFATNKTFIVTNTFYGGTNLTATNNIALAGQIVSPTASSAGWATSYTVPIPFNAIGTNIITGCGSLTLGFQAADAPRYLKIVATPGGSGTNIGFGAFLTVERQTYP